jgi:hypothetical protein
VGQDIELPALVLVGQRKQLRHGPRPDFAQGHKQPFLHGTEEFIGQ